jgi:hypothetical protein
LRPLTLPLFFGQALKADDAKMTHRLVKAPRGKHVGRRIDKPAESEAEHFMHYPNCGTPVDMRDLGQVPEHDTPLHIEQGRARKRAAIKAARSPGRLAGLDPTRFFGTPHLHLQSSR